MRVLFLQPKEYFLELIDVDVFFSKHELKFGYLPYCRIDSMVKQFDIVVSCIDHDENSRHICRIAKQVGCEVVFFQDGVFDFSNAYHNPFLMLKDKVLHEVNCYTKIFFTDFTAKKYFSNYMIDYNVYWPKRMLKSTTKFDLGYNPSQPPKVLISTANSPYFDDNEFERLVVIINNVTKELDTLNVAYDYRIYDEKLLNSLEIHPQKNKNTGTFESCIKSGYSALFSTPSSIVNTAAFFEIPVAVFDYRSSPMMSVAGWRIHMSLNIRNEIISIMERDLSRMDYQRRMLPDSFSEPDNQTDFINKEKRTGFEYIFRFFYKKMVIKVFNVKKFMLSFNRFFGIHQE